MECDCVQIWIVQPWSWAAQPAKLMVLIMVNGIKVMALVDSGCAQTIIRKSLFPDPGEPLDMMYIQCIYEDVKLYFWAQVLLSVRGHTKLMLVVLVDSLVYPVVLSCDWESFEEV